MSTEFFAYRDGRLYAEECTLDRIAAEFGTPCYVYSRGALEYNWRAFDQALSGQEHLVCYAVKANGNLAVLNVLARLGSGFDIVSGGELARVVAAGGAASRTVFSGVAKSVEEMRAGLEAGIRCFNVECAEELDLLDAAAGSLGVQAPVSLRVNPDVDAGTHPYIATGLRRSKFGIPIDEAPALYARAARLPHLAVRGVDCHIGSQLTSLAPLCDAVRRLLVLVDQLAGAGIAIQHLDVGGGLGVRYHDERPPQPAAYAQALRDLLANRRLQLVVEPGRAIAATAGVLLTRVRYLKHTGERHFALVDAGMNDLLRPALYDAWHEVVPVRLSGAEVDRDPALYDVAGPVCESGDFLARERSLAVQRGDLLAVRTAGAYGFSMSSNYNARPRPAEVMVDRTHAHLVRAREPVSSLYAGEQVLPQ